MVRPNSKYEFQYGVLVGDGMKGLLVDGQLMSWETNNHGEPHHDDVGNEGSYQLKLANYKTLLNEISISGFVSLLTSAQEILQFFTEYRGDTGIHVDLGLNLARVDFSFDGPILKLKEFFRTNPAPDPEDYEDGINDVDFLDDSEQWVRAVHLDRSKLNRTASEILGRGGRGDVWQEKDEDVSKAFSVYNNPGENSPVLNAAFTKWFGKSKVVDANGNPLVVYHGTSAEEFSKFRSPREYRGRHPTARIGIFFSRSKKIAASFYDEYESKRTVSAYLSIQNPFVMRWQDFENNFLAYDEDTDSFSGSKDVGEFIDEIESKSFDGIIILKYSKAKSWEARADQYVVFDPKQIKSIDNDGTWDADDPDIRSNPKRRSR